MGMLEKATDYAQEKGIDDICFARGMAEKLPFPDDVFDGVTCSAALHAFQDTVEALREMARVLKRSAQLAVLTVVKGDLSALKMVFERVGTSNPLAKEALKTMHIFDIEGLDRYLPQAGFKGFAYDIYGPFILFNAERDRKDKLNDRATF